MISLVGAIEVGGTHVSAAVVDASSGTVVEATRRRRPLDADRSASQIIGALVDVAAPVVDFVGPEIPLGVAIPGPFDYDRGIGRYAGVAKFEALAGLDVGKALRNGLGESVGRIAFLNDAVAFTLGEWRWGAGVGNRRVVGITLGTGIGSGFLEGGRVVTDDPCVPPEGAVHLLSIDGRPLEESVSRRALLREARRAIDELSIDADVVDVAALARGGDERAQAVFEDAFAHLGKALAPWLVRFDASVLVVGGAVARSWNLILPPIRTGLLRGEPSLASLTVAPATHPDVAALLGAATRAWERA